MLLLIDSSSPALLCVDLRERGMMLLSYDNCRLIRRHYGKLALTNGQRSRDLTQDHLQIGSAGAEVIHRAAAF
jgi:hypothetical protein